MQLSTFIVGPDVALSRSRPLRYIGEFAPFAEPLAKAFDDLQRATAQIAGDGKADPEGAGTAASDYLRLFGLTALAYMWARRRGRAPLARCAPVKIGLANFAYNFIPAALAQ